MTNRFEDSAVRHSARLQEQAGRSVVYRQGSTIRISGITAVPTDETYKVFDGDGTFTQIQSTDWIFEASSLAGVVPRAGDQITEVIGATQFEYDVMPIDKQPCFEWHDNAGTMLLLHSKRTK